MMIRRIDLYLQGISVFGISMKKIAAIHDLSCFGRASLTVAIPILSDMGFQVCPLPTAVLSAHSEYEGYRSVDLSDFIPEIAGHWQEMGLQFDAIYSGYMASEHQIDLVSGFFDVFGREDNFITVDPVLGDHGKLYPGLNTRMIAGMKNLCGKADIITPNLTEAALILGREPKSRISLEEAAGWCERLSAEGPGRVIITSVPDDIEGKLATVAYDRSADTAWSVSCEHIPAAYPGTGDAFASVIVGSILGGDSLPEALKRAVYFIHMGIKTTFAYGTTPLDGICQEEILPYLRSALPEYECKIIKR